MREEKVLCFERKLLEEAGLFQGLSLEIQKYLPVVTSRSNLLYLNRSDAEQDKRYKQLIPYVLVICDRRILRYQRGRGGQETRLHGVYSVGIGGHAGEGRWRFFFTAAREPGGIGRGMGSGSGNQQRGGEPP